MQVMYAKTQCGGTWWRGKPWCWLESSPRQTHTEAGSIIFSGSETCLDASLTPTRSSESTIDVERLTSIDIIQQCEIHIAGAFVHEPVHPLYCGRAEEQPQHDRSTTSQPKCHGSDLADCARVTAQQPCLTELNDERHPHRKRDVGVMRLMDVAQHELT